MCLCYNILTCCLQHGVSPGRSVMLSAGWESSSTMSTSDSDYSIDWLASDEDDSDSPNRTSPQHTEALPVPPPSSSATSLRKSPTSSFCSGASQRWRSDYCDCDDEGADSPATLQAPAFGPVQGFTSVCTQQTLCVQPKPQSTRKRSHNAGWDGLSEKPQPHAGKELFLHKVRGFL